MIRLEDYTPVEQGRQSEFVSEENKRKHIGENPQKLNCRRYRVDGNIIRDGKKCDFLLVNDDGKDAYFIELKGSNIDDAPEQIEATVNALQASLPNYFIFRRVVCSKASTHKIRGSVITAWKKKNNLKHHDQPALIIKEISLSEILVK